EEHEPSYKQGSAPRYHVRDAAAMRAQLEGARLILGSATPSLETLDLAAQGRVKTFALPDRVEARPLPPVEVVDLRSAPRIAAPEDRIPAWSAATKRRACAAWARSSSNTFWDCAIRAPGSRGWISIRPRANGHIITSWSVSPRARSTSSWARR